MKFLTQFLKQHSLVIGIILMFLLTWPIDLSNSKVLPFQLPFLVYLFLGYGIVVASLFMTGLTVGREGVVTLLKRFLIWRVGVQWYLTALLLVPFLMLAGVVLNAVLSGRPVDLSGVLAYRFLGPSTNLVVAFLFFILFDAVTNGEEIGWRGYVLPRLQIQHNALVSSLIVGVIWSLWHLPKFMAPGSSGSFAFTVVDTMTKAVFLTWLYNNTGGSLLLVTVAHAAWNGAGYVLPTANTIAGENLGASVIAELLLLAVVVAIVAWAGPARLSHTRQKQIVAGEPAQGPSLVPLSGEV